MGLKRAFRKIAGMPDKSFDEVDRMTTRELSIPDSRDRSLYIQFVAEQDSKGKWDIYLSGNDLWFAKWQPGFKLSAEALQTAREKHGASNGKTSFETAFIILRELEEAHLKYSNMKPYPEEPSYHYMRACRLLPRAFQEGLEDLYKAAAAKGKNLLPSKQTRPPGPPRP
jgi:hypothetical protein